MFSLCSQLKLLMFREGNSSFEAEVAGLLSPTVTPSQTLLCHRNDKLTQYDERLGTFPQKLETVQKPFCRDGDPPGSSVVWFMTLRRGYHSFNMELNTVLCGILLFSCFFKGHPEKTNSLMLQDISLLSTFCIYYIKTIHLGRGAIYMPY